MPNEMIFDQNCYSCNNAVYLIGQGNVEII